MSRARGRGGGRRDLSKMSEADLDEMFSNPLSRASPGDIHSYVPERKSYARARSGPYDRVIYILG